MASGGVGNVNAFNFGTGNTIGGSTGTGSFTFMDDSYTNPTSPGSFTGGTNTLSGGAGNTTVVAGPNDSIVAGSGKLEAIIGSNLPGTETVNLSLGVDGVRDQNAGGAGATVSVTGFNTATDRIESATSTGSYLVAHSTLNSSGFVVLNFSDKSTMTLAGVTNPNLITFTS